MKVKKISAANVEACSLPKLFDEEKIDFQPIQCVNWAEYPYKPKVNFRIAHTQNSILLHFKVKEESVRAKYGEDNGSVWTDSCVEFFSIPAGDGIYYNIECNCIGTILIGAGPVRNNREHAPKEVTALVQRWSSLGNQPFAERVKTMADDELLEIWEETQQLEGNPPASPGPLLIQGSEDQFLQGLSLPVAVVIRRLGGIHSYLSDSRKINPSISRTGSGLSPLPWQRPPRHRPESGA